MGDDAEYQMELDAEAAADEQRDRQFASAATRRPLFVLVEEEFDEISEQTFLGSFPGVFAAVHDLAIGLECLQASGLPDKVPNLAFLDPYIVSDGGRYEILIVPEGDVSVLRRHANHLSSQDGPLFARVSAELLSAMVDHIRHHPGSKMYVFARTVYR